MTINNTDPIGLFPVTPRWLPRTNRGRTGVTCDYFNNSIFDEKRAWLEKKIKTKKYINTSTCARACDYYIASDNCVKPSLPGSRWYSQVRFNWRF